MGYIEPVWTSAADLLQTQISAFLLQFFFNPNKTCHMSHVMCHMSSVTCHVSLVYIVLNFELTSLVPG